MKTFALVLVFTVFLAIVSGEIVPRFPGVQPIVINATATSTTPVTQFEVKSVIDPFTRVTDPQLIIILEQTAPPTVTQTAFDIDNSILGGERDIVYTATTGNPGAVFSAGAANFQGENFFSVSTIGTGSGVCEVQYDGRDSSLILDSSVGLRGVDLTNRNGNAISLVATTDLPSSITIVVYDNIGRSASYTRDITSGTNTYVFSFSQFQGVVSFSNVNAIVLRVQANRAVDIAIFDFNVVGAVVEAVSDNCFTGVVLPCDTDYYRLEVPENINVGDYVVIEYSASGEISNFDTTTGHFYLVSSTYSDLQTELATNENIVDTLGELPGPDNYNYTCTDDCTIEIVWSVLQNTTYYIAVEGKGVGNLVYQVCYAYRSVPVFQLFDNVQQPVFRDQILTSPPDDRARAYRYYVIDVPQIRYSEGTYLIVNISRAEPFPGLWMGLMYESLPAKAIDTGILGQSDFDSEGNQVDDVVYPFCVNVTARPAAFPNYDHPIRSDVREPCSCFTQVQTFGAGPNFQLTCELVVDPCQFKYGNWYIGVELPTRAAPFDAFDPTGFANYTIGAKVMQPLLVNVNRNVTYKSFVEPEAATHFKIEVPESDISSGNSHMIVQISNVRNGVVNVFVHKGTDETNTLAGGREACVPANATCTTSDACNIVIDKCHFSAGNWYVSVEIVYNSTTGFSVFDFARLPITYTLRANWDEESVPENLIAGVPVSKYIGSGLYDFYVIDVPPTIDTWLFVELFAKAEDTEVIIAMLHGDLPGGDCYARPDFYCMTGDPSETRVSTGPPTFLNNAPIQRESCTFMIQTCELQAGPLFISVYGHHKGYATYGDNTYYQVPAHYTLWADFDVALAVQSGVSYSETVFEKQYQHYYIRADRVFQGSSLSVEITNIQHGIPQTIEAFINYNYLAGDCPCYENLYNCTSNSACAANRPAGIAPVFNPDTETVLNCCTMIVPASDFRPGVWYIAVLGVNEDLFQYTTPIGYTITTTIHDAPTFNPLLLGQTYTGEVPQYNKTLEYAHFRLGAAAIPSNDLIFKVTFVQNCEFLGKHDDSTDQLIMYVNRGAPANQYLGGYDYRCIANTTTDSYCTIVVPSCEWEGNDYFVAIQGDYDAVFTGRFTLRAFTDEVRDYQLTDGVAHYDRVAEGRYKHFFITTTAQEDQYLAIDIYTNQDQDSITAYLNKDVRAGDAPCFTNMDVCETESMCSWQLLACEMTPGRYYISVYGQPGQFYDTSVEFTITASIKPVATRLFNGSPVTGHIPVASQVQHYYLEVADFRNGSFITFTVDNVKHGEITAYGQYGFLAGRCPCYIHEYTCTAIGNPIGSSDATNEWCEIRIPICDLQEGKYFFSIYATETLSPAPMAFGSPIGFTVEANLVSPIIVRPTVVVDRIVANTEPNQFVANERYNHFAFSWDDDDFSQGYHIIVEITSVRDGALNVFYSKGRPGDADEDCHIAQICTSGLGAGTECFWQIPYCLSKPVNGTDGQSQTHYISIEGITGRIQASYNILIYKQNVPTVVQNTFFTLDGPPADSTVFPLGAELNITHSKVHEPNGWTQFIRLLNVPAHADTGRGQMLELFFYRITNNLDQPLDFNVYVHPKEPAGAHECCSEQSELGSCQGAPCSHSADTTVSINNSDDVFSHTCSFGFAGVGDNGDGDAFFGQRCTVRVWPCEFNKYCGNETIDWFVSVVPLAPTDPASNGVGLSYSLQWRSRDIRLMSSGGVGSVDLNPIINNYEFSEVYNVEFIDTESEGWLSFHVDWNNAYGRLSVQTLFSGPDGNPAGSGAVVYIQGDEFASDTTSCYDYICSAGEDCAGASRFYVSESCSDKFTRYYITVRNTGIGSNSVSVQFRIVSTILPAAVEIPSHPSPSNVYVATSGNNVYGFNGVEGDNYDFYYLILDDDDLDGHQSWVIDISRPEDDLSSSPLEVYIRFGAEPGQYGVDNAQAYYGDFVEGSHAWQYQCTLPSAGARCQYQIQACDLIEGFWYISIHNPDFTFDSTPQALPQYTLRTYVDSPPLEVGLNQQVYVNRESDYFGLLQHFSVNVTVDALDFDDRTDITGYWTKYLRFQLDGITVDGNVVNGNNLGSVTLFVNYGDVAGPVGENSCLDNFASTVCNSGSCFVDVTPCQYESENGKNIKLVTGVYYVSVIQDVPSDYAFTARVYRNEYIPLAITDTLTGTGNEEGTTIERIVYTVTAGEVQIDGDGAGNYRYVIDDVHGVNDDLDDNEYFLFNISTSATTDNGDSLEMEVWRDDCTRFSCSVTGPNSWCVIDALTLSPATAKNGRFFIRVENPEGAVFTITYWHKEAIVQNLLDGQKLTEVVYPYQYQEYYYVAQEVGEGATLTVNVCVTCGDVEVYIRPDLPAGPYDIDQPQIRSAIDSCIARSSEALEDEDDYGCCTIFLDTCEYEQRGYYIGIRGVETVYPGEGNENLYLPAKYNIEAFQTIVRVEPLNVGCFGLVTYEEEYSIVPKQYAVDIETISVGTQVRVSIRGPPNYEDFVSLRTTFNYTDGYTGSCPSSDYSCSDVGSCAFIIPYCAFAVTGGQRIYMYADAPRGSEILVERWEPSIPIIHPNVMYSASINGPEDETVFASLPFRPNEQYYRIDLNPWGDETYYEHFFVRVQLQNVTQGTGSLAVNTGNYPTFGDSCGDEPTYLAVVESESELSYIDIHYDQLKALFPAPEDDDDSGIRTPRTFPLNGDDSNNDDDDEDSYLPRTFWITVRGTEQTCELHAIKYSLVVKTNWVVTYFPIGETICDSVSDGEYNFHRLKPHQVEHPQQSILHFRVTDLSEDASLNLLINDEHLATSESLDGLATFSADSPNDFEWICGYESLYFSVTPSEDSETVGATDYNLHVQKEKVHVKELFNDKIYYHDDDDDDACAHEHDFYIYRTAQPRGNHAGAFFRVLVDSEFPTEVYVNKDTFAWGPCHDSGYGSNDPEATGTTSVNVYDFCDFADGTYYITVVSNGPYYIYTNVRDDAKNLTIGQVFRDELEPAMYQVYTLEVCADWFEADDRLVVELSDVQNGDVFGYIRYAGNPGDRTSEDGAVSCAEDSVVAEFGAGESGYNYLLVNSCDLKAGTYHILIRASPHEGSPVRNCQHVTYRLFPYFIDYQIEPTKIAINTPVTDSVDFYTVNRIDETTVPFTRYYSFVPGQGDGFKDGVSQAVVRLSNVDGGLVTVRVMSGHLAVSEFGYISGETYGLAHSGELNPEWHMQSTARPFTQQRILDSRQSVYHPECDGCSDFCASTFYADIEESDTYTADKSLAVWIPSCYLSIETVYIAVEANRQNYQDRSISYELTVENTRDYVLIQPNTNKVATFSNDNWDYDFYYSISAEPESMRWRVVVTGGEGVLVTVRNHRCPLQATWIKEVWCDADYFDRPWLCDIEIPTRASHPGDNAFFVAVNGKNATYSIAFWRGRENCHDFTGSGRSDGLSFCAGLVPYATWRWDSYSTLDNEAECFFEELYSQFRVQPCWSGVTAECNATLAAFACYESFHRCDADGFAVGTCRESCDAVVYECSNMFESVNLEHYNCSSSRYVDGHAGTCSGNSQFASFNAQNNLFVDVADPDLILFKSSPAIGVSASSTVTYSFVLSIIAVVFALLI